MIDMLKNNCEQKNNGTSIHVSVDITKIVKYVCCAGVLIVGIIFGSKCYETMIKEGLLRLE